MQRAFAAAVVDGTSPTLTQAYIDVGYSENGTRKSLQNSASSLWRSAVVQQIAVELRAAQSASRIRRLASTQDKVLDALWCEAMPVGEPTPYGGSHLKGRGETAASRVAALRLIGQASAMFADRVIQTDEPALSPGEMIEQIQAAINSDAPALEAEASDPIDVTPAKVTDTLQ